MICIDRTNELLLAEVQRLSEADLIEPRRFAWTEGGTSLVTYVAANCYEHYHEHAEQISNCRELAGGSV